MGIMSTIKDALSGESEPTEAERVEALKVQVRDAADRHKDRDIAAWAANQILAGLGIEPVEGRKTHAVRITGIVTQVYVPLGGNDTDTMVARAEKQLAQEREFRGTGSSSFGYLTAGPVDMADAAVGEVFVLTDSATLPSGKEAFTPSDQDLATVDGFMETLYEGFVWLCRKAGYCGAGVEQVMRQLGITKRLPSQRTIRVEVPVTGTLTREVYAWDEEDALAQVGTPEGEISSKLFAGTVTGEPTVAAVSE